MTLTRRSLLTTAAAAPFAASALAADAKPLPPAIAALKSRKAEAKPITKVERSQRIENAKKLMAENKMDAIVLAGGTSLSYFTGIRWGNSERLFVCVITKNGDPFYVCPGFESDRAEEQISNAPAARKTYLWQEDENPYKLVAQGLKDAGIASGRIGLEEKMPFVFANGLYEGAGAGEVLSATLITAGCRARKSPAELVLMQLANSATLQAYKAAWSSVKEGMTNREFGAMIESAYAALGFPGGAVGVQTGEFTALPHGSAKPQIIREGSIVMIDDGCAVEGYPADITRTLVFGKPTDKMRKVFEIVQRAQAAALAAAKPGTACESVDAAARKVVEDAGYGPGYKYFTHRLGHGIGMDGHEWPYLVRGNKEKLAPNMTFSDEPGIYIRGEFGVRIEDDMYITEDGAKLFTGPVASIDDQFPKI